MGGGKIGKMSNFATLISWRAYTLARVESARILNEQASLHISLLLCSAHQGRRHDLCQHEGQLQQSYDDGGLRYVGKQWYMEQHWQYRW